MVGCHQLNMIQCINFFPFYPYFLTKLLIHVLSKQSVSQFRQQSDFEILPLHHLSSKKYNSNLSAKLTDRSFQQWEQKIFLRVHKRWEKRTTNSEDQILGSDNNIPSCDHLKFPIVHPMFVFLYFLKISSKGLPLDKVSWTNKFATWCQPPAVQFFLFQLHWFFWDS